MNRVVIVGGGQAAIQAIDTLRRKGFVGSVTLIGDEPWLPYQRPPLSKKYLAGTLDRERLLIRPAAYYVDRQIETRLGRRAERIDRRSHLVTLDDNSVLEYDRLLIATGSVGRRIPAKGADLPGVYYLRSIADVERIREDMLQGKRLVIVGGGYIGLEVAATARAAGLDVTILEMASRVMNRVVCTEISSFLEAEHTSRGVKIVTNTCVETIWGDQKAGRVNAVVTADGARYPADLVVVGVGVTADDALARNAGLECMNGIAVDSFCRTSDEYIYAAGDCTSHQSKHYDCSVRLESVDNAFEQATAAASNMLGVPLLHDKIPWFWSDQYDLKLVIVGLCQNYDSVVIRGDMDSRSFSVCYLRGGELLAIDTVNQMKDQMAAKRLIPARLRPNLNRLSDPRIPLAECI